MFNVPVQLDEFIWFPPGKSESKSKVELLTCGRQSVKQPFHCVCAITETMNNATISSCFKQTTYRFSAWNKAPIGALNEFVSGQRVRIHSNKIRSVV